MSPYISTVNEDDLARDFTQHVKNRYIDQKFLYLEDEAAETYYILSGRHLDAMEDEATEMDDYYEILSSLIHEHGVDCLISLGCGDASIEKSALARLAKDPKQSVQYIGVDISRSMIRMAEKNLKDIDIDKRYLHSDITKDVFVSKLRELTKGCKKRVYALFGGTLANLNQTNIADTLYNILEDGDMLWLDVRVRPDLSLEENMKLFKWYTDYLTDETGPFMFSPLARMGVPKDAGRLTLKMHNESSVGALLFKFHFQFDKKAVVDLNGEKIHFLPGETIKLLAVRAYHPDTLISFFEEHDFKLVQKNIQEADGQIIFSRERSKK